MKPKTYAEYHDQVIAPMIERIMAPPLRCYDCREELTPDEEANYTRADLRYEDPLCDACNAERKARA